MAFHVFLFLLVFFLLLSLALLWRLRWFHLQPSHSQADRRRTLVQRLLKPRSLDDCPACRLASTPASSGGPVPALVRPWREVKSWRGAPRRIPTEGSPVSTRSAHTSGSPMLTFMLWLGMASMAGPSRFRPLGVRPAAPPSVLDVTRSCIG